MWGASKTPLLIPNIYQESDGWLSPVARLIQEMVYLFHGQPHKWPSSKSCCSIDHEKTFLVVNWFRDYHWKNHGQSWFWTRLWKYLSQNLLNLCDGPWIYGVSTNQWQQNDLCYTVMVCNIYHKCPCYTIRWIMHLYEDSGGLENMWISPLGTSGRLC